MLPKGYVMPLRTPLTLWIRQGGQSSFQRTSAKYTKPEGGLFLWIELNDAVDTVALLEKCLEYNVAFVPGNSFYPNRNKPNTLRINFSNMPEDRIEEGIARIGQVLDV